MLTLCISNGGDVVNLKVCCPLNFFLKHKKNYPEQYSGTCKYIWKIKITSDHNKIYIIILKISQNNLKKILC